MPEVPHQALAWRAETEVEDLRQLDIGLLPLPLTRWAPHKFYLKLIQYMALGIPSVATPLGSNSLVIEEGRTGFLVRDELEWTAALERLVEDSELRELIGRAGAEEASRRYTVQANAERIVAALRSALAPG